MKIWIVSDTHFNHEAIKEYEWRPDNFNEIIIDNLKSVIKQEDTLIHLWDVIFNRQSELENILKEIPWTKILVKWNHDQNKNNWYLSKGFNLVCDKIELRFNHKKVILTHIPIKLLEDEYNLHWHLHSWNHRDEEFDKVKTDRHILYSPERYKYKPILLEEILNFVWK